MNQTILIILGIVIIVFLLTRRGREGIGGICSMALDRTVRKSANKEKALALLQKGGAVGNEDIREALGASRRSVTRYMTELEREGKVEQVGASGRGVMYRLK